MVIVLMGISGSGKSRMSTAIAERLLVRVVCPDEYRKKMFGSINVQSNGAALFARVNADIQKFNSAGDIVIFDATNLHAKELKNYLREEPNFVVVMLDSKDPEKCFGRITADLLAGKDRSAVPQEVVDRQFKNFTNAYGEIKSSGFTNLVEVDEVNFNTRLEEIVKRIEEAK